MTATTLSPIHYNNPSREIVAGSGLYTKTQYGTPRSPTPLNSPDSPDPIFYASDVPNSLAQNPNIFTTTTSTLPPRVNHALQNAKLSNTDMHIIDDMLVFNNYVHYYGNIQFNPRSFLAQANVNFNLYSMEYR